MKKETKDVALAFLLAFIVDIFLLILKNLLGDNMFNFIIQKVAQSWYLWIGLFTALISFIVINRRNSLIILTNLKESRQIIKDTISGGYYLVEKNNCYHIPDSPTNEYLKEYFGFNQNDVKQMVMNDIKSKYIIGKKLPSILPYCLKQDKQ